MGEIYKMLGLTVGCIQHDQPPFIRRQMYQCDITYGTNSEFGFDYLRDNGMPTNAETQVKRGHFYAIVDEVDSILIDEARTPLIISGPSTVSTHQYDKYKPQVAELYRSQTMLCNWIRQRSQTNARRPQREEIYTKQLDIEDQSRVVCCTRQDGHAEEQAVAENDGGAGKSETLWMRPSWHRWLTQQEGIARTQRGIVFHDR
jgi:preprotein translocase subunit SecA